MPNSLCRRGHPREKGKDCKECARISNKAWRERNAEQHRNNARAWNAAHPDRASLHRKKNYAKNLDARRAASRAWYYAHREEALFKAKRRRVRRGMGFN